MDAQFFYTGPPPPQQPQNPGPRRRPRGSKACLTCVSGKRRCDGGSLCSNCYFSFKDCIYTDTAGNPISPPPRRLPNIAPGPVHPHGSELEAPTAPIPRRRNPGRLDDRVTTIQDRNPPMTQAVQTSVMFQQGLNVDPILGRDLLELFFARCYPHKLILHRPTFLSDVTAGRVPSFLIKAVFALASPYCDAPLLSPSSNTASGDKASPIWQTGSYFADSAFEELFDPVLGRVRYEKYKGLELEVAQTCCILAAHATICRRGTIQNYQQESLLREALALLVRLGVPDWDAMDLAGSTFIENSPQYQDASGTNSLRAYWRRRECFRRTLWVIHASNIVGCAMELKDMQFRDLDVKVFLPIDDSLFAFDMDAASLPEGSSTPTLTAGPPTHPTASSSSPIGPIQVQHRELIVNQENDSSHSSVSSLGGFQPRNVYISEFGHYLRLMVIYGRVMTLLGKIARYFDSDWDEGYQLKSSEKIQHDYRSCLASLQHWQTSLPSHLRFNNTNLATHAQKSTNGTSNDSWSWALGHMMAECCMLVLHEVLEAVAPVSINQSHLEQCDRARGNMVEILECMGPLARHSYTVVIPLMHLGPPLLSATPIAINNKVNSDSRLKKLYDEFELNFGISPRLICSNEFRGAWVAPLSEASPFAADFNPEEAFWLSTLKPRGDVTGEQYLNSSTNHRDTLFHGKTDSSVSPPLSSTQPFCSPGVQPSSEYSKYANDPLWHNDLESTRNLIHSALPSIQEIETQNAMFDPFPSLTLPPLRTLVSKHLLHPPTITRNTSTPRTILNVVTPVLWLEPSAVREEGPEWV